jgi:hypothetical protein
MTLALLLAAAPDRLSAMAQPYRQPGDRAPGGMAGVDGVAASLARAGVGQVEVAMCADAADGLRAVAATARATAARAAAEPVLVCTAARVLATPRAALAALLGGTGSAAVTASGTLFIAAKDLPAAAEAAERLAARVGAGDGPQAAPSPPHLSVLRIHRRTRVSGELNDAVLSLIDHIAASGMKLTLLSVRDAASVDEATGPGPGRPARPAAVGATARVPAEDGLVAGLAGAPLAGRIARWAAARGLAPNALSIAALALGLCAAAWLAAGTQAGLIAGAVLLCAALPVRQARALLPAGGPAAAAFGGWLEGVTSAGAEFAVYAALAVAWPSTSGPPRQAWEFATAAMILLAVRQMAEACHALVAVPRQELRGPGYPLLRLAGQSVALPAGERTLLIAVTAPVWGPRMTLIILLGWGAVALGYSLAERAVARRVPAPAADRDDGGRTARSGAR